MPARDREGEAYNGPEESGLDYRAARLEHTIEEPDCGFRMGSKADHLGGTGPDSSCGEPHEMRVVAVEHGDAAGFKTEKDLGLGIGDSLDRREKAEMGRSEERRV